MPLVSLFGEHRRHHGRGDGANRRARDEVRLHPGFVERINHPDLKDAAENAAAEKQRNGRARSIVPSTSGAAIPRHGPWRCRQRGTFRPRAQVLLGRYMWRGGWPMVNRFLITTAKRPILLGAFPYSF